MYEGNAFGTQLPSAAPRYEDIPVGPNQRSKHAARQVNEWRDKGKQSKSRQRACKICSTLHHDTKRASPTTYFCGDCNDVGPIFLCMRARGNEWVNGTQVPVEDAKPIRVRRKAETPSTPSTSGTPASRRRHRTSP
ncbi:hypothetical protein F444_09244 [Phytophthora nicotianae P1976]|uniref:PiggyBac transposable element-derived protein 4 C-terminal zinc-ribbon domain-containing protein n=1 Tax=Phytophthora nicotianae P1976 TaxID=1317066 RepID=A0A081A8B4_PHYNI|nr:hypothetical protein F444_09244 [Phytophthora nicotianae P1976]